MPIFSLDAVRLLNASIAAGFQLLAVSDDAAAHMLRQMPALLQWLARALDEVNPELRFSVEMKSICTRNRLRVVLRHGLNVRFRFPADTLPDDANALCAEMQDALLAHINHAQELCVSARSNDEGTAHMDADCWRVLTKERKACKLTNGSVLHYSPCFSDGAAIDPAAMFGLLRNHPGCGCSVQFTPADTSDICTALVGGAARLPENSPEKAELLRMAQADAYYTVQTMVFSPNEERCNTAARMLCRLLTEHGLACRLWESIRKDELQAYHFLVDPWSLQAWSHSQIGGRLSVTATLLTGPELRSLMSAPEQPAPEQPMPEQPVPVAQTMDMHLNADELAAFGVTSEDALKQLGMDEDMLTRMQYAVYMKRCATQNTTIPDSALMNYGISMGILYEQFLRTYFTPGLLAAEIKYLKDTQGREGQSGDIPLSRYDFVNFWRSSNYAAYARVDGTAYSRDEWTAWFNCFRCLRFFRNKIHGNQGNATREEMELIYRLLFLPGVDHKLNALRYAINHPHPDAAVNASMSIFQPDLYSSVEQLLEGMKKMPAHFEDSLLRFILRCATAQWLATPGRSAE
ncbi:MAG: hypothetical protein ACI4MJ_11310 [Aristaeellaceae bacterium]